MTIDERWAALPEPIRRASHDLVMILGGLSQEEKLVLMRSLDSARRHQKDQVTWTADVFGGVNDLVGAVFLVAMPSPERFIDMVEQLEARDG